MLDIRQGDALELLKTLPGNSVDLIATDPPYYRVKKEVWDRAWDKPELFLTWLDSTLSEFQRVLKPNGSLYLFASPRMSARVEVLIGERFNVLNHIVWRKEGGTRANQADKEGLRAFFGDSERIIFAEQNGFIFEPVRKYLDDERQRLGLSTEKLAERMGSYREKYKHYMTRTQWELPTPEVYADMQRVFDGYFLRPYEALRLEYEHLRRPFYATPDAPYTDVWTFKTVKPYAGKHPCEKPLQLMQHIIKTSSRPGAVVLDAFMGSGSTAEAALSLGRDFIGFDLDAHWVKFARSRCDRALSQTQLFANAAD